jgi:hypothetical protein
MKLPHIVKYTRKVEGGKALGPYIRINPKFKDRPGLLAHEYEHVKQWYISLILFIPAWYAVFYFYPTVGGFLLPIVPAMFGIAKRLFKPLRYAMELRAFAAHVKHEPDLLDWAASALSSDYGLNVNFYKAKEDLQERLR